MKLHWRFAVAVALLAGTGILLQARNGSEIIAPRQPLSTFPKILQGWNSNDLPLDQDVRERLGPGDFLVRRYKDGAQTRNVDLYIAYFPSQRAGDTIHSPKNCLPVGSSRVDLQACKLEYSIVSPK